jgi:hypothetical protein
MKMLDHFLGRRFDLAELGRRFEAEKGKNYSVEIATVPARIATTDLATAYTIAEFVLNLLSMDAPPLRSDVEEYVRQKFAAPEGGFRFSCNQDFLQVRRR